MIRKEYRYTVIGEKTYQDDIPVGNFTIINRGEILSIRTNKFLYELDLKEFSKEYFNKQDFEYKID